MKNYPKTVSRGTIYVGVLVLPGAQVGRIPRDRQTDPSRIKREIAAANNAWQIQVNGRFHGIRFKIVNTIVLDQDITGLDSNAEKFPMTRSQQDEKARILIRQGKKVCRNADVFIFYMNGNSVGPAFRDGSRVAAISFIDYPIIIMSNSAQENDFILAHELGHFLFNNNRFGQTSDPNPYRGDSAHNASSKNLMYPTGDSWPEPPQSPMISPDQLYKALNTRFFYE